MPPAILVVDDDPAILHGVSTLLEQAGYSVHAAASGEAALAHLASAAPPALVVLDLILPHIDGLAVCRALRQRPPYIPILMLSARDELVDKVLGLELGADDYVTKPFEPRELLARVHALLRFAEQRAAGPPDAQPLIGGPLRLDRVQHRAFAAEHELSLSPKEWALLELFLAHPGQVFGRETLLQHVWGQDFLGDSRTVDVHVQRLRAKLEVCPAAVASIQTIRGFGYRFVAPAEAAPAAR